MKPSTDTIPTLLEAGDFGMLWKCMKLLSMPVTTGNIVIQSFSLFDKVDFGLAGKQLTDGGVEDKQRVTSLHIVARGTKLLLSYRESKQSNCLG